MASESERRSGSALSVSARAETWNDRFRSLSIESPLADERAFKVQLAIGEDAYLSSRLFKAFDSLTNFGVGAAAGGAAAASSAVAGTFFSAGGFLGLVGLGTAATPVGWVLAAAGSLRCGVGSSAGGSSAHGWNHWHQWRSCRNSSTGLSICWRSGSST